MRIVPGIIIVNRMMLKNTLLMRKRIFAKANAAGASHGNDFRIADVENACVLSAEGQLSLAAALLSDDARLAREVVDTYEPLYPNKEAYFADWDKYMAEHDLLIWGEDGSVTVNL